MQALESLAGVDIVNLCSPLDADSRLVLFHSAAAVLANSEHEPFGLVGLETMAAGGVACIGYTGEDYAVPGHNALVLETNDPQEFLDLFGTLRRNPTMERALRRAGRITAQHYTWSQIMHRILLPRLHLIACFSNRTTPALQNQWKKERKRAKLRRATTFDSSSTADGMPRNPARSLIPWMTSTPRTFAA